VGGSYSEEEEEEAVALLEDKTHLTLIKSAYIYIERDYMGIWRGVKLKQKETKGLRPFTC
jgi:hypothetical protein